MSTSELLRDSQILEKLRCDCKGVLVRSQEMNILECDRCSKKLEKSENWIDFTDEVTKPPSDIPTHLVDTVNASRKRNFIKRIILKWHNQQEEKFIQRCSVVPDSYIDKILELLKDGTDSNLSNALSEDSRYLLDVGGGTGRWSFLSQRLGLQHVVVDVSNPEHLPLPRNVIYLRASADDLPLQANAVTAVTSFEMLEHVRFPEKVIQEMYRVLKSDGVLLLTTRQYWKTHGSPHDFFRYTRLGLESLLSSNGFEVITTIPMGGPASLIATVIDQNVPLLSKPVLKEIFLYPLWWLARRIDETFYLSKKSFIELPDTSGWLVFARKLAT